MSHKYVINLQLCAITREPTLALCNYFSDWKEHGVSYECSRYKDNPETATQARAALTKYLFYFERVCLNNYVQLYLTNTIILYFIICFFNMF